MNPYSSFYHEVEECSNMSWRNWVLSSVLLVVVGIVMNCAYFYYLHNTAKYHNLSYPQIINKVMSE